MIYNIDYVRNKPLVTLSDGKRGNEAGSDEPSEDQARDIYIYIYIMREKGTQLHFPTSLFRESLHSSGV